MYTFNKHRHSWSQYCKGRLLSQLLVGLQSITNCLKSCGPLQLPIDIKYTAPSSNLDNYDQKTLQVDSSACVVFGNIPNYAAGRTIWKPITSVTTNDALIEISTFSSYSHMNCSILCNHFVKAHPISQAQFVSISVAPSNHPVYCQIDGEAWTVSSATIYILPATTVSLLKNI
uniref:Diacylglycerol kinase eta n=1 Tax=Lygus hesperus TaxID=30085 RepID=A0A0A9YGT6_LYGHE